LGQQAQNEHFVQKHLARGMEPGPVIGQDRIMINPEDDRPLPPKKLLVPPPLDDLGLDELETYIQDLMVEIMRVKTTISVKESHKTAVAAMFKTPPADPTI
jgi:uncharacterized small protein (DUF1192 family)